MYRYVVASAVVVLVAAGCTQGGTQTGTKLRILPPRVDMRRSALG